MLQTHHLSPVSMLEVLLQCDGMYTCRATRYTGKGQVSYHRIWIPLMGISRKVSDTCF
ncbi:hypothetical protein L873DRAFT_758216 [Choiromyces venosus 120613-1]|uniref:Uncharacterized protein n=1 Tax=Choiromyces venosus 120613-1 TaxID=1336337 RepID=A0A3N4JQN3_9PEZI|nr:hypothetical protein L873DRAFT_758216 [Choiromyces venosus 120613-1]